MKKKNTRIQKRGEFNVFVEKVNEIFDDKMKIVENGFKSVHEKLDSHTNEIADLKVEVTDMKDRLDVAIMDIKEIKSDMKKVKLDVNLDLERKVDRKHFIDLDQRVKKLEKKG
jgi:hypothetical protein